MVVSPSSTAGRTGSDCIARLRALRARDRRTRNAGGADTRGFHRFGLAKRGFTGQEQDLPVTLRQGVHGGTQPGGLH